LEFTDSLKSALTDTVSLDTLYNIASKDGLINLRQVAIRKMLEGVTTYEEVIAVTG
jgi:general secretion pathway protein E